MSDNGFNALSSRSLVDLMFTSLCPLCEQHSNGSQLCAVCTSWLSPLPDPCPLCAAPNTFTQVCGRCQQSPPSWHCAKVSWALEGAARFLVHRMKYHQDFASARALASHWWHHHGHQRLPLDALVPVPLHRHKARHRGFNQSEWLARYLATSAGIDVWTGLIKAIPTQPLEGLNRTQRRQTLRGVFTVTQPPPKRVAIVDDVLTTGATAAELARTLKRAGTQHIELWTLARTPLGDG